MLLESKVSISRIFFSVLPSKNFPYLQRWLLLGSCGFMSGIKSFSGGMYVDISVEFSVDVCPYSVAIYYSEVDPLNCGTMGKFET